MNKIFLALLLLGCANEVESYSGRLISCEAYVNQLTGNRVSIILSNGGLFEINERTTKVFACPKLETSTPVRVIITIARHIVIQETEDD